MSSQIINTKKTVPDIVKMKKQGEKISMLTAYDYLMAEIIDSAGIDVILVGDSAGMVVGGKENTLSVTMEEMLIYTQSVKRGVSQSLLIADMPFLSYQVSLAKTVENAGKFLQVGAEGVKIEGGSIMVNTVEHLVSIGIPVMAHIGLMPQSMHQFGGFKIQGKTKHQAKQLIEDARLLEEAGAFSIVLEKIPAELAQEITSAVSIPTIGIGAGSDCDGQVLVTHDMLGLFRKFHPKFVRRYAELGDAMEKACRNYISDVKASKFPNKNESY